MERLTIKGATEPVCARKCEYGSSLDCYDCDKHKELLNRLAAYEDTGVEPEEIEDRQDVCLWIPEDRFSEIIKAEADDRLVVLPCKVGDVVYELDRRILKVYRIIPPSAAFIMSEIENGIEFYKTREEAEKALEGGERRCVIMRS